jgi:hypothetical protein
MAKHQLWADQSPDAGILQCFAKTKNSSTSISCGLFRADSLASQFLRVAIKTQQLLQLGTSSEATDFAKHVSIRSYPFSAKIGFHSCRMADVSQPE